MLVDSGVAACDDLGVLFPGPGDWDYHATARHIFLMS